MEFDYEYTLPPPKPDFQAIGVFFEFGEQMPKGVFDLDSQETDSGSIIVSLIGVGPSDGRRCSVEVRHAGSPLGFDATYTIPGKPEIYQEASDAVKAAIADMGATGENYEDYIG